MRPPWDARYRGLKRPRSEETERWSAATAADQQKASALSASAVGLDEEESIVTASPDPDVPTDHDTSASAEDPSEKIALVKALEEDATELPTAPDSSPTRGEDEERSTTPPTATEHPEESAAQAPDASPAEGLLDRDFGLVKIGTRVRIFWSGEQEYFAGTIAKVRPPPCRRPYFVEYDDGDTEWVDLDNEVWQLIVEGDDRKDDVKDDGADVDDDSKPRGSPAVDSDVAEEEAANEIDEKEKPGIADEAVSQRPAEPEEAGRSLSLAESLESSEKKKKRQPGPFLPQPKAKKLKPASHSVDEASDALELSASHSTDAGADEDPFAAIPWNHETDFGDFADDDWVSKGWTPPSKKKKRKQKKQRISIHVPRSVPSMADDLFLPISEKVKLCGRRRTSDSGVPPLPQSMPEADNLSVARGATCKKVDKLSSPLEQLTDEEKRRRKEEARPLTAAEIQAILGETDAPCAESNHWVRRSVRQPSKSCLDSPQVRDLIEKLKNNDPDMVVLKMKKYINDPNAPQVCLEAALDALEENTNCEALYIQNFNEGMRDDQIIHLLRILQQPSCNVWCLNLGETYKVKRKTWKIFAKGLRHTKVTHMYMSEHTISGEMKELIRSTIRDNRSKHSMHIDPDNLDTIVRCTHCWWNPINAKSLRPYIKSRGYEYVLSDKEAQGLKGYTKENPNLS